MHLLLLIEGSKRGQHSHWMLVWVSSIQDPKHPLSGIDTESYSYLHVVPPGCQPKGKDDCRYLTQRNHAYSGWVRLFSLLAAHLGEGNSYNKPMGRRGLSALLGILLRRGKLRHQIYGPLTLLSLSQLASPWQMNLVLFFWVWKPK